MGYKFNPFTGNFDATDSPDGVFESVEVDGDITLDDGGTYTTTVQTVTPTANRTISFPDATGTVALVAGSNGQLIYNNAGAQSGLSTLTTDGTDITLSGRFISSLNGAASEPPGSFTGTWFTGGTATTTKPQVLIEPSGTTSTAWSTNGTGLGINAASGFSGNLLDLQVNGGSVQRVTSSYTELSPGNVLLQQGFNKSLKLHASYGIAWQAGGVTDGTVNTTRLAQTTTGGYGVELTVGVRLGASVLQATNDYTVATLPASAVIGMITRVTDGDSGLTFGNTVVNSGAGATPYLVWYNGTNWTVIGA